MKAIKQQLGFLFFGSWKHESAERFAERVRHFGLSPAVVLDGVTL